MHAFTKLAAALSVTTVAAIAGPALADQVTDIYTVPIVTDPYYVAPADTYVVPADTYVVPADTDSGPGATYYYEPAPATTYYYDTTPTTTTTTTYYEEPAIVVTGPRSEDEAITNDVVDRLAGDPRLSGQIGVETYRNNVTLRGRVTTRAQVDLAEQDAKGVDGVDEVNNYLRARVGEQ